MTHRNVRRRLNALGPVLAGTMMAPADLVGPGKPRRVILGPAGVENPLAKALAHGIEISADRLAGPGVAEISQKMRRRADEAVPNIENGLDLILDDIVGLPERRDIVVAEKKRCFECRKLVSRDRRLGQRRIAKSVAGNGNRRHGCTSACEYDC